MTAPVAVTGAAGFVGQALIARLLADGISVRALTHRRPLPLRHARLEVQRGALEDPAALSRLVTGCRAVVHVAGVVRGRGDADFRPVNVEGAARIARSARAAGVRRFILISSLAARAPALSAYAASKRAGEAAVTELASGTPLSCAVLRPPAVYGAQDRELLPLLRLMAHGITPLPGPRGARASLLHVEDLAAAVATLLKSETEGTFPLHDGHAGGYDWPEIAAIARAAAGRNRGLSLRVPAPLLRGVARINLMAARTLNYRPMLTPGKVNELRHPDWVCDNKVISAATGWCPAVTLPDGLAPLLGGHDRTKHEGLSNVI